MSEVILYRLQPWPVVDALVQQMCPPGFELVMMARDAGPEERHARLREANFLMGSWVTTTVKLTEEDFRAGQRLKLIQLMSAGYEHVDLDLAERYGIPVAHFGGSNASVVAEHTLLLILALYRRLVQLNAGVKSGAWRVGEPVLRELRGKRVGIIGMGYIGREVAARLHAFQTEVVYFSRTRLEPHLEGELGVRFVDFDELLKTSDIVSLNVALTSRTRGMLGERELGLMKPDAILINTSRGAIVDEPALAHALERGALGGAGLDVLEQEPPDLSAAWLQRDNVICTPHNAGSSDEVWTRVVETCFANIERVTRGEPPLHLARKLD
jgi:phosphoglycerate dehydrogenase-like enzyme